MTKEIITRVKLTASKGMVLTDGETYGTEIFLEEGKSESNFREITQEEYDELFKVEEDDTSDSVDDNNHEVM